jgi:hypothetical protein
MNQELTRRLAWESSDHWESTEIYKHYLPAILERISPPNHADSLYPEHFFEALSQHNFQRWERPARDAVIHLLACAVEELNNANDRESIAWTVAAREFIKSCDEEQGNSLFRR